MTRRNLVRANFALFALGLALTAGAFVAPTNYQIITLALGLGSITFSSGFWAVVPFDPLRA